MFDKLMEELAQINEGNAGKWSFDDIAICKPQGQVQQGEGGGSATPGGVPVIPYGKSPPKPGEGKGKGKGQPGKGQPKPGQGQPGEEEGEGEGQPKPGQGQGQGQGQPGQSASPTSGEAESMPVVFDNHEMFGKNYGSPSSQSQTIKEWAKEMEKRTGKKDPKAWGDSAGYLYGPTIVKLQKQQFPLSAILRKLDKFKADISKQEHQEDSYYMGQYSGASMGGVNNSTINSFRINTDKNKKQSAVLFFAIDTSGSMWGEDTTKLAYGWLDSIAEHFTKEQSGVPGKVYVIEFDTTVKAPLYPWVKGEYPLARGNGGTNVQAIFDFLNKHFVAEDSNKLYTTYRFKLDETETIGNDEPLFKIAKNKKPISLVQTISKIPAGMKGKQIHVGSPPKGVKFKYGDIVMEPKMDKIANVPFLMIFTDGDFGTPSNFGPLYQNNMGNILYVLWKGLGIHACRPKNFVYCDIEAEDENFEDQIELEYGKK